MTSVAVTPDRLQEIARLCEAAEAAVHDPDRCAALAVAVRDLLAEVRRIRGELETRARILPAPTERAAADAVREACERFAAFYLRADVVEAIARRAAIALTGGGS